MCSSGKGSRSFTNSKPQCGINKPQCGGRSRKSSRTRSSPSGRLAHWLYPSSDSQIVSKFTILKIHHDKPQKYTSLPCSKLWLALLDKKIQECMPPKRVWYLFISIFEPLNIHSERTSVAFITGIWRKKFNKCTARAESRYAKENTTGATGQPGQDIDTNKDTE